MNKRLFRSLFCIVVLAVVVISPAFAQEQHFTALQPGQSVTFEQTLPINLVFVGYDERQTNRQALQRQLPATYKPVTWWPLYYGVTPRDLGLNYTFDYHFIDANARFENEFFKYLTTTGRPAGLTDYQQLYNDQKRNVLNVTGPVLYIDAPSTEKWLQTHSQDGLGLNTSKGYTIYFINWYSRPDFRFHVYTKTDEPDPDTGVNFGEAYDSRTMIAWGGEHSRTWFYDLSAGPEDWTANWNVDTRDLDGNNIEDYRMPPIWEYRSGGYRAPSALGADLGRITRFVGIDLMFAQSPLYDPLVATPGPGGNRVVHIELFNDDPNVNGEDFIDPEYIRRELRNFQPYYDWQVHLEVNDRLDTGVRRAFRIFTGLIEPGPNDCATEFGDTFASLFCYFDANLDRYVPAYGPKDYVSKIFAFNTTDRRMGDDDLLGYADDNWVDGTQTYLFAFDFPGARETGYGLSTTAVHELGHHIGMSHPHDGYDSEKGLIFGPADEYFYAWSGDESRSIMSYIDLNVSFGHFDRDNMYRWEMAGYLNQANLLLDDILARPGAARHAGRLQQAENRAQEARGDFENWNYLRAAANARYAYQTIAHVASALGIEAEPSAERLGPPRSDIPRLVDPIRRP